MRFWLVSRRRHTSRRISPLKSFSCRLISTGLFQLPAQLTGNTSLAYYARQLFNSVGAGSAAKLVTEAFGYNISWGPLPWLYVGEIFSGSRTRQLGVTAGAVQFHNVADHATCNQQLLVLEDCHFQLRHHLILLACSERAMSCSSYHPH